MRDSTIAQSRHRRTAPSAYYAPSGQYAGERRGADILYREVKASGIYKNPPGIAWHDQVVAAAAADGCTVMVIYRSDTRATLTATFDTFRRYSIARNHGEPQHVLALGYWRQDGQPSEHEVKQERRQAMASRPQQMGLFA